MNISRKLYTGALLLACLVGFLGLFPGGWGDARAEGPRASGTPARFFTPTVTASPTPEKRNFSLVRMNSIPPADVLADMYVFGGAGGSPAGCDSAPKQVQDARELMDTLVLRVCWPAADAKVSFRVLRPDGRVEFTSLSVVDGEVKALYQPYYDYPPGVYALRLEGATTSMAFEVLYREPHKANLTEIHAAATPFWPALSMTGSRRRLLLDHFVPAERVRLIAYKQNNPTEPISMIGWQDLTIGSDGRMPVNVDLPGVQYREKLYFAAFGERSGEVHSLEVSPIYYIRFDWAERIDLYCPGSKLPRLHAWTSARVISTPGAGVVMRSAPGTAGQAIAQLPPGAQVLVVGGPRCTGTIRYWEVDFYSTGTRGQATLAHGWVAEAEQGVYRIEPAP